MIKSLISQSICQIYKDHMSFLRYHCLNQCVTEVNCDGKSKIKVEEENLASLDEKTNNNQKYIDEDILLIN